MPCPGRVNSALSDGCNRLIGREPGYFSLRRRFWKSGGSKKAGTSEGSKKEIKNEKMLESAEKLVYSCLGLYPKDLDQLVREEQSWISRLSWRNWFLWNCRDMYVKYRKNHYIISE